MQAFLLSMDVLLQNFSYFGNSAGRNNSSVLTQDMDGFFVNHFWNVEGKYQKIVKSLGIFRATLGTCSGLKKNGVDMWIFKPNRDI